MTAPAEKRLWSPAEYLAEERASAQKHELFQGEVFAMAGASAAHNLIVLNVGAELRAALRPRPCRVYASDLRIKIEATGLYTYPDVTVVCGPRSFDDEQQDSLLNPTVIFEVLSSSTESYDRGKKFEQYRTIPSLREYVLIAQDRVLVEHFVRQDQGAWLLREARAGDRITLASVGCELAVDEAYLKVFEEDPRPPS